MPLNETAPFPTGWMHRPDEVQGVMASLPRPLFGAAAPNLEGSGAGQTVLLYKAFKDINGDQYVDYPAQTIGDCVSHGTGHGIDLLEAVQIALGHKAEEFHQTATEAIYGMARVDVGGQRGSYEDGAVGAWAAKAVSTLGTVSRDVTGPYDGRRAKDWGAKGVPQEIEAKAREHPVKTVSLVSTYAELEDAIANGFPVTVCSNQGFTLTRDAQGFCLPKGTWAHCCPPDAMIGGLTPKRADQVQVGDDVIGHDGRLHRVVAAMSRPHRGEMAVIKVAGLPPVRFTPEHPVLVEREVFQRTVVKPSEDFVAVAAERAGLTVSAVTYVERKPARGWVPAGKVKIGDRLLMPMRIVGPSRSPVPRWVTDDHWVKNMPREIHEPNGDLAWLFGMFIANGHSDPGHRVVVTLPASKPDLERRTVTALRLLGLEPIVARKDRHVRVILNSSVVANTFKAWFGGGDTEKRIPEFLFSNGWDLEKVVEGIHAGDGDGSRFLKKARIYTTSRTLMNQLWMILTANDRHPNIYLAVRSTGTYANAKPLYAVNFTREVNETVRANKSAPRYTYDGYAMPVKSVCFESYDGMVYNWEVEGSNSYVADGVAVHNCMLICGIRNDSRPGALIFQSWGPNVPSGPLALDQPNNSFWADRVVVEQMLAMRDSWTLSNFTGYPAQTLPEAWTYAGFA